MTPPALLPAELVRQMQSPEQLRLIELISAIPSIGHGPRKQKVDPPKPVIHSHEKQYHRYRRLATPTWLTDEERAQMRAMYRMTRGTRATSRPLRLDHGVRHPGQDRDGFQELSRGTGTARPRVRQHDESALPARGF